MCRFAILKKGRELSSRPFFVARSTCTELTNRVCKHVPISLDAHDFRGCRLTLFVGTSGADTRDRA